MTSLVADQTHHDQLVLRVKHALPFMPDALQYQFDRRIMLSMAGRSMNAWHVSAPPILPSYTNQWALMGDQLYFTQDCRLVLAENNGSTLFVQRELPVEFARSRRALEISRVPVLWPWMESVLSSRRLPQAPVITATRAWIRLD